MLGMPLQSSKHTFSKTYNITLNCTNSTYNVDGTLSYY